MASWSSEMTQKVRPRLLCATEAWAHSCLFISVPSDLRWRRRRGEGKQATIVILNLIEALYYCQHKIFCIVPARSCVLVLLVEKNKDFPSGIFVWSGNEEKLRLSETLNMDISLMKGHG